MLRVGDVLVRDTSLGEDIAVVRELANNRISLDVTWSSGVQFVAHYAGEADVMVIWDRP